jgi:hypothetical protein
MKDQDLEQIVRQELREIMPNMIWRNEHGEYEVFGRYKLINKKPQCEVWNHASLIAVFNSTRTAISWCIADKYQHYNLARQLLIADQTLGYLNNDIVARMAVANRTKKIQLREDIEIKLEPKIIRRKQLENELSKCVDLAKYLQQKGFENETARSSRTGPNKTSR